MHDYLHTLTWLKKHLFPIQLELPNLHDINSEPSIEDPLGWFYKKDLRWKLWFVKVRDSLGALSFGLVSQAWKNFPEKIIQKNFSILSRTPFSNSFKANSKN